MWKIGLGFIALVAANLAAQAGVIIALRSYALGNLPSSYQILLHTADMLNYIQFGAALFLLSFGRIPATWPQTVCSAWVAAAATLGRLQPGLPHRNIPWNILFALTSLWAGYAIFILARWHFGLQVAPATAENSTRKWLLTPATAAAWATILAIALAGCLLLHIVPRSNATETTLPIWATSLLYATVIALLLFPLLFAMLTHKWTWLLSGIIILPFIAYAASHVLRIGLINPAFGQEIAIEHSITLAAAFVNALFLRLLGLRWREAEPWPAKIRPQIDTVPNPFA